MKKENLEKVEKFFYRLDIMIEANGFRNIREFCDQAGLDPVSFYNYKSRKYYPPIETLIVFSRILHCSLEFLLTGCDVRTGTDGDYFTDESLEVARRFMRCSSERKSIIKDILLMGRIIKAEETEQII